MANTEAVSIVTGTIGTILWCIQLIPQIIYNYRNKNCEGLPPLMMFLWAASGIPFAIYFIVRDSYIPMQVQPVLFSALCTISWIQTLYYPPSQLEIVKIVSLVSGFLLIALGMMLGFILWLRPLYIDNNLEWPSLIFGVLASIMLVAGLVPPYIELAKREGRVLGINFLFLSMDSAGAAFSMISVLVDKIDIMGAILYAAVLIMELGIFTSHIIWWLRIGKYIMTDARISTDVETSHLKENELFKSSVK
ncbi:BA75_01531T0 [Komagataella pastoris]|uniref:BA75_01531T0 n=1 Tax=Komagataella pastoris TaxID=4922 RepID=A0A1B2J916_PICPA|nr:BA75_01531T0 [Komagataella pastoris]